MGRSKLVLIALVCFVAVGLGVFALYRDAGSTSADGMGSAADEFRPAVLGTSAPPVPAGRRAGEIASRQLSRRVLREGDAEKLGAAASAYLAAFHAGDAAAFHKVLDDQQLVADTPSSTDPGATAAAGALRHMADAELYPEKATWSTLVVDGKANPSGMNDDFPDLPGTIRYTRRPDTPRGPKDVPDAGAAGTTQLRLLIPAKAKDAAGKAVYCRLELLFTRRPADGEWILTGTGFANVPAGARFGAPPVR